MKAAQVTVTEVHFADAVPNDPRRTALALAVAEIVPAGVTVITDREQSHVSYKVGPLPHDWIQVRLSDADQLALADQGPLLTSGDSDVPVTVTVRVPEAHEVMTVAAVAA